MMKDAAARACVDNLRPKIEDRLGRHSDSEVDETLQSSQSSKRSQTNTESELERTLIPSTFAQALEDVDPDDPSNLVVTKRIYLEVLIHLC